MDIRVGLHNLFRVTHGIARFVVRYLEGFLIAGLVVMATYQYMVRPQSQSYDEIMQSGELRVLITDEPDSQYVFDKQHYGFEYELLSRFADSLGVELKLEVVPYGELFTLLESGAGDLAVGGILGTKFVEKVGQPTIPWFQARTTVVYKRGTQRPRDLDALKNKPVLASSRYFGLGKYEELKLVDDHRSEYDLLTAVATGEERFVLSTSYRAKNAKHYLPDLNRGFLLQEPVDVVWVLPKRHDSMLLSVLNGFLRNSLDEGLPNMLAESYLALPNRLSTYDALYLQRKIKEVLPDFEFAFRRAARRGGIDWQLLAAMAYQESRWSNDALSPTGVRGIMQLTTETAEFLGVDDRLDMSKSINAAGDYILFLKSKLPKLIKEPERTWFAVAAYNMGLKHVLYAYRKARDTKVDRTNWNAVSQLLPTLYDKPFRQGVQAKSYVERVQIFTDILRFYDLHQRERVELRQLVAVTNQALEE